MVPKVEPLYSKARKSAASGVTPVSSAGRPPPRPHNAGRITGLDRDHLDGQRSGVALTGGSPASTLPNTHMLPSASGPAQTNFNFVFNNNRGNFDMGAIHSIASSAGHAPLPGSDGILPTPPAPSNALHLRSDNLRRRLEPRHPPARSVTLRSTMPPPAGGLPTSTPLPPRRLSVAAARRVRWKKSQIRQQAAAIPTPPDANPPPPVEPLPPSSVDQITAAVLAAIQARLPGPDLAAGCPGHLPHAASAPPAPPPSAGPDPALAAHPGATNAFGPPTPRCGDGAPAGLQSSLLLTPHTSVPNSALSRNRSFVQIKKNPILTQIR